MPALSLPNTSTSSCCTSAYRISVINGHLAWAMLAAAYSPSRKLVAGLLLSPSLVLRHFNSLPGAISKVGTKDLEGHCLHGLRGSLALMDATATNICRHCPSYYPCKRIHLVLLVRDYLSIIMPLAFPTGPPRAN